MKALILSGGAGTRLRPITHTSAKQLIPIANKPILFYGIEFIRDAGITDIGIIVGETKEEIKDAVSDGSKWGIKVTYIEQDAPLGLAHAVKISQDFIREEPFVMFLGDNIIKGGIKTFVERFKSDQPNALILLTEVENPQQFGVAELNNGKILRLIEKPKDPKSNLALVGVYLFDKNIFEAVNKISPSRRNELEITDAIQYLLEQDYTVNPYIITGWWKDTGRLEDMLDANRLILDTREQQINGFVDNDSKIIGKVVIEEGTIIKNSTIRGPSIIGRDTQVINSYIGPYTSIYFGTKIINSEIEHSIVLENCIISDISFRIEDSLIGKNVTVVKSLAKPKAYRFMLGDYSNVGIL
ncbi:MAG: glucose-1-phosphate thymidylyltransferase [bacterium]|nr:glucose-1-phosphate thymidylyltransferase [bacterium]